MGDHLEVARAMRRDLFWERAHIGPFGSRSFEPGQWSDVVALSCKARVSQPKKTIWFVILFFAKGGKLSRGRVVDEAESV